VCVRTTTVPGVIMSSLHILSVGAGHEDGIAWMGRVKRTGDVRLRVGDSLHTQAGSSCELTIAFERVNPR